MESVISEGPWFGVIRASPDPNIKGNLVRRWNLLGAPFKLTPLSTHVIDVESRPRCVLPKDRNKICPVVRRFQNHFNCSYGANALLIGGRAPRERNQKEQPPHARENIGHQLSVNVLLTTHNSHGYPRPLAPHPAAA